jgi:hypothetical protein
MNDGVLFIRSGEVEGWIEPHFSSSRTGEASVGPAIFCAMTDANCMMESGS